MPAFIKKPAGLSVSTILPDMDFETFSPAGFVWNAQSNKWGCPTGTALKGLPIVGTVCYTEHPETELLSLAYNLKNGKGAKLWRPGEPPPFDLFNYLAQGGIIEAWNSAFEYWVWNNVAVKKYNFPPIKLGNLRCAMAKARAYALPGKLEETGKVLKLINQKDKNGERLLKKFSVPRTPTKNNSELRNRLTLGDPDSEALWQYNLKDIAAEGEASSLIPDLNAQELLFWQYDQIINVRGVQIDLVNIHNAINIVEQVYTKYNNRINILTNGEVTSASKIQSIIRWLAKHNVHTSTINAETITALLNKSDLPAPARQILSIREMLNSASIKKLYSMLHQVSSKNRLHNLFVYHSARTGRAAGAGVQPQNLPKGNPVKECQSCLKHYNLSNTIICPWCGHTVAKVVEWNARAVMEGFDLIKTRSLPCIEYYYENPLHLISGCLRGLFIAATNHDLIGSDYSAIEAVVLAALAGEDWRLDVFKTHGQIYEMSASKITGIPFEEFERYKIANNQHHPARKKIGKVAELASGYGGYINAWKNFGASEFFNDDEIKKAVLAWRKNNPSIVEMWGGQEKDYKICFYGLEGMAISAVIKPGTFFEYRGIKYIMHNDILYCQLLSGRYITYHKPRLVKSSRGLNLSFEGWNTNIKYGAVGWVRMNTYGGKLTENIVQATARDILAHAIINLEKAGYKVVLHVHDEIVVEVPENISSIEEIETIMNKMPDWAANWPIKASGGWRAKRYQK